MAVTAEERQRHEAASVLDALRAAMITAEGPAVGPVCQFLAASAKTGRKRIGPIAALIRVGAMAEAAIVARSMLELEFSAAYVWHCSPEDRVKRAERFFSLEPVQLDGLVERAKRFISVPAEGPGIEAIRRERAAAVEKFAGMEASILTNWTGERGWKGVIKNIPEKKISEDLEASYVSAYFHLSMYAHPTPVGLREALCLDPLPGDTVFVVAAAALTAGSRLCSIQAEACGRREPSLGPLWDRFMTLE